MKLVLLIAGIVCAFLALIASLHGHVGPQPAWLAAALLFYFVSTVARK